MSKDQSADVSIKVSPQVGDIWVNIYDGNKYIVASIEYYFDEKRYGMATLISQYYDKRLEEITMLGFTYLGKSKVNIEQLFEVCDD